MGKLITVMDLLIDGKPLPSERRDHPLRGEWQGDRECHIEPDWLLVYKIEKLPEPIDGCTDVVTFLRTGTHSDIGF